MFQPYRACLPVVYREATLSGLVVNTTDDGDDHACNAAHCSLREAIYAANAAPGPDTIRVPVVTLDAVLDGRRVHGIKLDVEGFELEALRGAEGTLRRWRPWLGVEFNTLLAGFGAAWLFRRIRPQRVLPLAALLIFVIFLDFYPGPYQQLTPVTARPVDAWLAQQPGKGAVAQFPFICRGHYHHTGHRT